MADQETMNPLYGPAGNGAAAVRGASGGKPVRPDRQRAADIADSSPAAVVTNVASFGENLLNLAELQARLTTIELRRNFDSAKSAGVLIIVGAVLAVAGLPVLLIGIAELLMTELGIKRGYALLTTSTAAIVVGVTFVAIASHWLGRHPLGLGLAGEEFNRNMNWLRTILRQSGRWPRRG